MRHGKKSAPVHVSRSWGKKGGLGGRAPATRKTRVRKGFMVSGGAYPSRKTPLQLKSVRGKPGGEKFGVNTPLAGYNMDGV